MDIATVLGVVSAFGLVIIAMLLGGSLIIFIDVTSLLIVVGGTIGAGLIAYPMGHMTGAAKIAQKAFLHTPTDSAELIKQMVDFSSKARREGILALEKEVESVKDEFMVQAIQLAVDGQESEAIENLLSNEIAFLKQRHKVGAEIFTTLGAFAPALGLIGTLIGLVQMLQSMDDPSAIGPAMAVALLTTFYGAVLANLVFNPIAEKLKNRSSEEVLVKELILEGILAISIGDNPRLVEQKLKTFLAPNMRAESS